MGFFFFEWGGAGCEKEVEEKISQLKKILKVTSVVYDNIITF